MSTAADDEGFLRWDPPSLAARVSPYDSDRKRERDLERWAKEIVDAELVEILGCGCAMMPRLPAYLRAKGGEHIDTIRAWHDEHHLGATTDNDVAIRIPSPRDGSVRDVSSRDVTGRLGEVVGIDERARREPIPELTPLHPSRTNTSAIEQVDAWLASRGAPVQSDHPLRARLEDLVASEGAERVIEAMAASMDGRFVGRALKVLRPSRADRAAADADSDDERHRRAVLATKRRAHWLHETNDEPDAMCPDCQRQPSAPTA